MFCNPEPRPVVSGSKPLPSSDTRISYFPGGLVLLLVLLPDGTLPGRRWRWLIWFDVLYIPVVMALVALGPSPIQLSSGVTIANPVGQPLLASSQGGVLKDVIFVPVPFLLALTIVALILRLVRSRGEERQQLKWIVFASAAAILAEQQLRFEVFDEGRGFDQARGTRGAGLTNMEDRLDALGGKLAMRVNLDASQGSPAAFLFTRPRLPAPERRRSIRSTGKPRSLP
jgi:hypothetical protein